MTLAVHLLQYCSGQAGLAPLGRPAVPVRGSALHRPGDSESFLERYTAHPGEGIPLQGRAGDLLKLEPLTGTENPSRPRVTGQATLTGHGTMTRPVGPCPPAAARLPSLNEHCNRRAPLHSRIARRPPVWHLEDGVTRGGRGHGRGMWSRRPSRSDCAFALLC